MLCAVYQLLLQHMHLVLIVYVPADGPDNRLNRYLDNCSAIKDCLALLPTNSHFLSPFSYWHPNYTVQTCVTQNMNIWRVFLFAHTGMQQNDRSGRSARAYRCLL